MQLLPKPPKPQSDSLSQGTEPTRLKAVTTQGIAPQPSGGIAEDRGLSEVPRWETQSHERVMIFIDGSNLFYSALQLNLEVDYTKLLRCLTRGRSLVRAYFYTGVDPTNTKQQGFLMWMRRNGFRVVTKDLIHHPDGSKKANLDVEIAIDMLSLAKYCDTVILLSGDGDLTYAAEKVAYQGVRIEVASVPSMLSEDLKDSADLFIDLTALKSTIQKGHELRKAFASDPEERLVSGL